MTLIYLMIAIVLAVAGAAFALAMRGKKGAQPPGQPPTTPYEVAYLHGGPSAAIGIALFHLCTGGLLNAIAGRVKVAKPGVVDQCEHDLERTIVNMIGDGLSVQTILKDPAITRATQSIRSALTQSQLLADDALQAENRTLAFMIGGGVAGLTLIFAIVRVVQGAADAGQLFGAFVVIALLFAGIAMTSPRLTPRGVKVLANLQNRYKRNADSKTSAGGPESLIIAGLFGFTALPETEQPLARIIFYKGKK
jgi:uncharacterized protein (TIGR04222 family)